MKKLVVFYSLTGNTGLIAGKIAEKIGADVLELKPKKDISKDGVMKYFWGGKMVTMGEKPELCEYAVREDDYDLIVIGTPIWAWDYAPAIASWLKKVSLKGKKIAMFCCSGSSRGKVFENIKGKLAGNEFVGEIEFSEDVLRKNSYQDTLFDWIKSWDKA